MKLLKYVVIELRHLLYTKGDVKEPFCSSNSSILAHFIP